MRKEGGERGMGLTVWQIVFRVISIFYLVYLLIYTTFMFGSVALGAFHLYERDRMRRIRNQFTHDLYFPVSVLVPAYNEEVTILASIESLLALDYKLYEVIVVDDGSKDATAARLVDHFHMRRVDRPMLKRLPCQAMRAVYEAKVGQINLMLIIKENGGKGDALNMGINASQYPYFLCIDADSMLQRDTLERIVQPVLEDDSVVAVGGMIRAAQCAILADGVVQKFFMPRNPLISMQVVEYDRSFLSSRILMDQFNGNLIISGALGLFQKDVVVAIGGYDTNTLGEDMELVMKLHVFCRNHGRKYAIRYEPSAICWSQVPSRLRDIMRQRRRWHLGLFQSMMKYKQMLGNTRFGLMGYVSYIYYLLFELFSPAIELFGILMMVLLGSLGLLNPALMIRLFLLYGLYGAIMTLTAFFQRIYTHNLKMRPLDILKTIAACVLESVFFRYVMAYVRATAFISYKKRKRHWGTIKRDKVNQSAEAVEKQP
jgi:biofilm PGA synthesis N-glycosyltransferase PgaC